MRLPGPLWPFVRPKPAGPEQSMPEFSPPPESPVEKERRRLEEAEMRMSQFCWDLDQMTGREDDELSRQIYQAAREKDGVELELDSSWMMNAAMVLAKLRRELPARTHARVVAVAEGGEKEALEDVDAARALEHAARHLGAGSRAPLVHDLAACLLGHAFAAQDQARGLAWHVTATSGGFQTAPRARAQVLLEEEDRSRALALRQSRSLAQLGRSLRWTGTLLLGMAFALTGQLVFVPMVAVLWLMTWMLVDRRALEKTPVQSDVLASLTGSAERAPTKRLLEASFGLTVREFGARMSAISGTVECSLCGGAGFFASTFEGEPVCPACADARLEMLPGAHECRSCGKEISALADGLCDGCRGFFLSRGQAPPPREDRG